MLDEKDEPFYSFSEYSCKKERVLTFFLLFVVATLHKKRSKKHLKGSKSSLQRKTRIILHLLRAYL